MAGNKAKQIIKFVDDLKEFWPEFYTAPNEFINPTLNSVIKFYERFILEFGIKSDTIFTLFNQNYGHCQQYEDIMYVFNVYSCASRIYRQLEMPILCALSLTNFVNPTDDKCLIARTSLLVNFMCYLKVTSANIFTPLKENVMGELDILDDLEQEENKMNEELKTAVYIISSNIDKLEKLDINNNKLKHRLSTSQLESEELNKKIQILTAELKLIEEVNATLTDNIENNMKNKIKLESLVVDDHEAILAEQNKVEKELAEEELQLSEHMKNIELKTLDETNLIKNYEVINNFIETFNLPKLLDIYNSIEEHRNEKEKLIKESHTFQRTENEERNLKDHLHYERRDWEEKLLALNLQSNIRLKTLENKIIQLNKEHGERNNQFKKSIHDLSELNDGLQHVANCCDQYTQEIEKQNKFYEMLFSKYSDAETSLNNIVVDVLALIKEKMAKIKSTENLQ